MSGKSSLAKYERDLKSSLFSLLQKQGFRLGEDQLVKEKSYSKKQVRQRHAYSRNERLLEESKLVEKWLPRVSKYFASGSDIDLKRVDPYPVVISESDDEFAALFRIASLWWSIPVSKGFGRRFRILIFDRSNDKLIGLLALTDPVFNLRTRDSWVGWNVKTREKMLAHVMDACVLGAVPPYNEILGAKLVALIASSNFVRDVFRKRYKKSESVILGREFDGRLAMVTATSALGVSSIYNRLSFDGVSLFNHVGFTEGYGHFHLANGTYEKLREYLRMIDNDEVERYKFGSGPNYRIRIVRTALENLGLSGHLLRHGIKRAVYLSPLAANTPEFLRGETKRLRWFDRPLGDVVDHWKTRWMLPRAERDQSYLNFDKKQWKRILKPREDEF
ncbi:MAG: DUF4338 domain-containing protein [Bdellovibrionota bacterium]|nr:MAG: DUF4338 domain-containing protein [Bdellovibrionota bacterium]